MSVLLFSARNEIFFWQRAQRTCRKTKQETHESENQSVKCLQSQSVFAKTFKYKLLDCRFGMHYKFCSFIHRSYMLHFVYKAEIWKEKKVDSGSSSPTHILSTSFSPDSDHSRNLKQEEAHISPSSPLFCDDVLMLGINIHHIHYSKLFTLSAAPRPLCDLPPLQMM